MAVPPRPANSGVARGGLAVDIRAPHVSAFPVLENLEITFPHKKNRYKVRKYLRKIPEGMKSNLELFSSLTLLPILHRF
jgi:hypothetical protein